MHQLQENPKIQRQINSQLQKDVRVVQPSGEDILTNTKNCRWTHPMILVKLFQQVTHFQSLFQVVVLQQKLTMVIPIDPRNPSIKVFVQTSKDLVHVNRLKCFPSSKNNSMVLIFRLSLSYLCCTGKFYTVDFLEGEIMRQLGFEVQLINMVLLETKSKYLIKIINSFDQHRIVHLLRLSTHAFFNLINVCYTERWITEEEGSRNQILK